MDMGGMGMGGMSGMGGSSSSNSSMGGMDMGTGDCLIRMIGNWDTIHTCFLTPSWHINTEAQFAGTVIFVFLLTVIIEFVRRLGREYDRRIMRAYRESDAYREWVERKLEEGKIEAKMAADARDGAAEGGSTKALGGKAKNLVARLSGTAPQGLKFRPTLGQQFIRSMFYVIQFTGAYLIMLFAMYFNGYILLAVCIGGFAGHFASSWDSVSGGGEMALLGAGAGAAVGLEGAALAVGVESDGCCC